MTARLAHIYRHPIKAHGREELASVRLLAGKALPFDRTWAIAHEAARLTGGWVPCANFARGAKAPKLMAIEARFDEAEGLITLTHPDRPSITFVPDDPADEGRVIAWLAPLNPQDRAQPARIVRAEQALTDTDFPSVSILSLTSLRILSKRMGLDLSPHRFRGNLWLEGLAPWEEFDLVGRIVEIGEARLEIVERITRCTATTANPSTGRVDAPVLQALEAAWDHSDFGVYARVVQGGVIRQGDEVTI
jgi:uncharacterized protein YcbX